MNLSNLSKQVVSAIKQTSEYQQYKVAKLALDKNIQSKNIVETFQNHERQILESKSSPKETQNKLQTLYKQFERYSKQPEIAQYLKTSEQLNKMMQHLFQIIGEELN